MFIWWRLPITAIPGPHLFDLGSFAEHADEIRLDLHQRLKLQNRSERNPADIMAQQEAFQTHSHNQCRCILQWVIETSIKGSNILMGTEKEEMIPCSYRCFLIFLWSGGTFGEWQMLRWPVSPSGPYIILVSLSHILAYHQVRHRPPVQLTGWGGFTQWSVSLSKLSIKDVPFSHLYVYIPIGKGMLHYYFLDPVKAKFEYCLDKA